VAIFVSRQDHALLDLLWRTRSGELPMVVPLVISNHPDLGTIAADFGAHFVHLPVSEANRAEAEQAQLALLQEHRIALVVLAKYMQVLSPDFLQRFDAVINIHHSFLPAFQGAQPYHRAWERGVKLIGATAHYVTADLDEGPIIEQDVARVDHSKTVEDLTAQGRDTESQVLARAVKWHSEHRVLINGHKTVIFK
jgi:formyltetrahydrofolate deformylase